MAMPPPSMVDQGNDSPSRIKEKIIAVSGTTYINADAFSDPNFMVVWKKMAVPNPNDTTEIMRKLIQNTISNVNIVNSCS